MACFSVDSMLTHKAKNLSVWWLLIFREPWCVGTCPGAAGSAQAGERCGRDPRGVWLVLRRGSAGCQCQREAAGSRSLLPPPMQVSAQMPSGDNLNGSKDRPCIV